MPLNICHRWLEMSSKTVQGIYDIPMGAGCREGQQDRIGLRGELVQAQFAAEASMPHANARSRTLMARLQARRFRQIYEYLAQVPFLCSARSMNSWP